MFRSIVKPFILMIIFIVCIGNFSFAKNIISNISIDVVINDDGSANITQTWDGTFEEGTECYLPIDTNDFEISNLTVKMGDKRFKNIEWDLNKSFEEKSYKCGINKTDVGVELCFGISKYGKNKYTFSYDISKLVGSYTDYDGFNFQFVNTNMDSFPTNVEWKLKLKSGKKLTSNNCKISCSGYEGIAEIKNGIAVAKSMQSLNGEQYFDVAMQFDKGIIKPQSLPKDKSSLKSQIENAKLVTEYSKETFVEDMDTVTLGSYPQTDATGKIKDPIEWVVLERDEETKRALLLSKYVLDCKPYNTDGKDLSWETCSLRGWMNKDFYSSAFNENEKNYILEITLNNCDAVEENGPVYGNDTNDRVFCLSLAEIIKISYNKKLSAKASEYAVSQSNGNDYFIYTQEFYQELLRRWNKHYNSKNINKEEYQEHIKYLEDNKWSIGRSSYWLRTPVGPKFYDGTGETWEIYVEHSGRCLISGIPVDTMSVGVRPALWVSYGSEDDKNNTGTVNVDSNKNLENAYETWDDNMFNESSYTYNHKVARISAMLCEASYNTGKLKNMILNHFGFSNIQLYNYDINDSIVLDEYKGTNCFSISHKTTNDKTILLVTVRGTNTIEEIKGDAIKRTWWDDIVNWFSGSTYDKNEHKMFNQCNVYDNVYDFYEQVEKGIYDYLSKDPSIKKTKNMKVLITGHSLGGAAANLYGAALVYDTQPLDNKYLKHEDIFTYTFGSIKVIEDIDTNIEEGYENVFDIYNHYDSFGPNGNYAWTNASSPYQKFGHTFIYDDERLHFGEINEPHLWEVNGFDVLNPISLVIKSVKHIADGKAMDFVGTFNNHDMKNYMAALNLYDFSKNNFSNNNVSDSILENSGNDIIASENRLSKDKQKSSDKYYYYFDEKNDKVLHISSKNNNGKAREVNTTYAWIGLEINPIAYLYKDDAEKLSNIEHIVIDDKLKLDSTVGMFSYLPKLKEVNVNLIDTSKTKYMQMMFVGCEELSSIDVSAWDTSNVVDMSFMFKRCYSLKTIDVSGWNTNNVTNMAGLFNDCEALNGVNVSKWNVGNVTNIYRMFNGCSSIEKIDVSKWDTKNVTKMSSAFSGCTSLKTIDVSKWDTSKVTAMDYTFNMCTSLLELNVSNWNTSSVTLMNGMFANCSSLVEIDVSKWDTSQVVNMLSMFEGCSSLVRLDVKN